MDTHGRGNDYRHAAYFCPDHGEREMVDRGNADGDKRAECMARPAGTALLQEAHHACSGELPHSATHPVFTDGNGTDLRSDDNGSGRVADIFPTKGSDILLVLGILYSGRSLSVADNGQRDIAETSRKSTHTHTTAMAVATSRLDTPVPATGDDADSAGTDVL